MELTLQDVYFVVGVAGFAIGAVFAIATVVYFFRADIRAVRDDLSGKTRQAGLLEQPKVARRMRSSANVLTRQDEWQGRISHGNLDASSGSDAITDSPSGSASSDGLGSGRWEDAAGDVREASEGEDASGDEVAFEVREGGDASVKELAEVESEQGRFTITMRCVVVNARGTIGPSGRGILSAAGDASEGGVA